ncbi:hypothetical protein [Streptomyces luteireticuli]|uniref:hypothetical protein n=1 Tax=Streptomyces luteireticuli TaxID=173858 RepID=UPI0035565D69
MLTGALVAGQLAYGSDTVSFDVASMSGDCTVSWTKAGITFQAAAPGSTPSSFTLTGGTGTVDVAGDPIALAVDPAKLGAAITMTVDLRGGFTLSDGKGGVVEVSDGQAKAPISGFTYLVKSPANSMGLRMAALDYPTPPQINPKVVSILPVKLAVDGTADLNFTAGFAKVLNDTFGVGTASGGQLFGSCAGRLSTA